VVRYASDSDFVDSGIRYDAKLIKKFRSNSGFIWTLCGTNCLYFKRGKINPNIY
jgi:hypothetical protein